MKLILNFFFFSFYLSSFAFFSTLNTVATPQIAVNNTIASPNVSYPLKSNTVAVTELIAPVLLIVSLSIILMPYLIPLDLHSF